MKNILSILLLASAIASAESPFSNRFFPEVKYESKGHFYLKEHEGRHLSITPEGTGFYPIGINHLNAVKGDASQKALIRNMVDWGFNCGGYGTDTKTIGDDVYYLGNLHFLHHGFYRMNGAKFPDVFDASFELMFENMIKQAAESYYDPKRLMGMVWCDLPSWNIFKSRMLRRTDWVSEVRNRGASAPGKQAYAKFLKKRYQGATDKLKQYYKLSDGDLKDLESYDFSKLYVGHPMIMEDDQLFMAEIAEKYYQIGKKYHDKYLPNIPLLGDRYLLNDHPEAVLKVAAKYVDAISIQVGDGYGEAMPPSYPFSKSVFDRIHEITKKPILIADHQISFYTDDYKKTTFSQAGDERKAGLETKKYLEATFSEKYIIGYFRCTYLTKNEPHGRGVKQGLVGFEEEPHSRLGAAYRSANLRIGEYVD